MCYSVTDIFKNAERYLWNFILVLCSKSSTLTWLDSMFKVHSIFTFWFIFLAFSCRSSLNKRYHISQNGRRLFANILASYQESPSCCLYLCLRMSCSRNRLGKYITQWMFVITQIKTTKTMPLTTIVFAKYFSRNYCLLILDWIFSGSHYNLNILWKH